MVKRKSTPSFRAGHKYGKYIRTGLKVGAKVVKAYKTYKKLTTQTKKKYVKRAGPNAPIRDLSQTTLNYTINKSIKNKSTGRFVLQQITQTNNKAVAGKQGVSVICAVLRPQHFTTAGGVGYGPLETQVSLMDLNPNQKTSGSAIITTGVQPLNDKIIIKTVKWEISLRNFATNDLVLDVYVLMCKKVMDQYPDQIWNEGLVNNALGQTVATFPTAASTTPVIGYPTNAFVGQRPWETKLFNQHYKICRKKRISLASFAQENIKSTITVNKIYDRAVQQDRTDSGVVMQPGTMCIMVVAVGGVVNESTANLVTYGSTDYGVVINQTVVACQPMGNSGRLDYSSVSQRIPSSVTLANQEIINEADTAAAVTEIN